MLKTRPETPRRFSSGSFNGAVLWVGQGLVCWADLPPAQSVGRGEAQGVELLIDLDTQGVNLCVSETGL